MVNVKGLLLVSAVALAPVAGAAATVTIDSFDTAQFVITPSAPGFDASSTVAAGEAIGGSRTITAAGNGTLFPVETTTINVGGGTASVSNSDDVTGTALFEWMAGGFDLTDGGTNDTFVLDINTVDLSVSYDLTIDGITSSSAANAMTGTVEFAFADFGNLADAGSISLLVAGPASFDASFSFLGAEDLIANPSAVPLPAGGLLLGSLLLGGGFVSRRKAKA